MLYFCFLLSVLGVEHYFEQVLDHFAPAVRNVTFKQRYFVNDQAYEEGGPGFLYIGGESAIGDYLVQSGLALDLATEHRGVLYALEHRYYGKSHPFAKLTVENLKFLSSKQALEDLAYFAKNVGERRPTKWFLIGGSYPGNLAAWGRQKYPDLFHGALASSAPVEVKADFQEYDAMVGLAFGETCHSTFNQLMAYVDDVYASGGLEEIKEELKCKGVQDNVLFLYTVADAIASIVQTNDPNYSPNIKELCQAVSQSGTMKDKLTRVLQIIQVYFKARKTSCYGFTGISDLKNQTHSQDSFFRQWTYQSCQEFGYWQTASKYPTRSKHLTLDWFNKFYCSQPFFTPAIGPPNTTAINSEHRGKQLNVTNLLFTNGQFDPWSALSNMKHNAIVIANASHVSDLGPPDPTDSDSLLHARHLIKRTFRSWMNPSQKV